MAGQKVTHKRGPSWSQHELQIIDNNLDLTAEQLALLLPRRTPLGVSKKRAERHGRRSRAAERGCWSVQDEAICRVWNAAFALMNRRKRALTRKGRG